VTEPLVPSAAHRGRYLATALDTGLQVGVDEFEISRGPAGWRLWSRHTSFGAEAGPGHVARFELDAAWVPLHLEVTSTSGTGLVAEFGLRRTVLHVRRDGGGGSAREERIALPVGRYDALVLLAGGLSLPLLAVRRALDLGCGAALQLRLLPDGLCELRRERDRAPEAGSPSLRLFDMSLIVGADRDRLRLAVDGRDDLVRFHARNRNLLVELDTAGAC